MAAPNEEQNISSVSSTRITPTTQVSPGSASSTKTNEERTDPKNDRHAEDKYKTDEDGVGEEGDEDEDEDEDEEDMEPRLKYTRVTGSLSSVYRRNDSTSAVLSTGDKMIYGTHNGNIHVMNIPSLQTLRLYHAHSASVTAISASPFSPKLPAKWASSTSNSKDEKPSETGVRKSNVSRDTSKPHLASSSRNPESFHIATSSIDGHVCISSLADPKDVMLRNFARPVQAVALSPEYNKDRMFLTGGLAGNLILTVGGRPGASSNANTHNNKATASGWLSSLGLSSNTGKDTILHSGEGSINTISWSLSGKYVAWVNEKGIKIMRSCIGLDRNESDVAWKRVAHIDHPSSKAWSGMSNVWKARAHWTDDRYLEQESVDVSPSHQLSTGPVQVESSGNSWPSSYHTIGDSEKGFSPVERLTIGWGDTVWVIDIRPRGPPDKQEGSSHKSIGKASIVHRIVVSDGIVSGLTFFTAKLLLIIVFRSNNGNDVSAVENHDTASKKGIRRRQKALRPDLRLIDLTSNPEEEIDVESLPFSKFESLSSGDYNLSTIFMPPTTNGDSELITTSSNPYAVGWGNAIWDAGKQSTRIFSSGASVFSGASSGIGQEAQEESSKEQSTSEYTAAAATPNLLTHGLKVFVHSPYDCILASKRDPSDRLKWLLVHDKLEEAWLLIDQNPAVVTGAIKNDSGVNSPTKPNGSIAESCEDDNSFSGSTHGSASCNIQPASVHEKRRIGNLWVQKLVKQENWRGAAEIIGRVIETSSHWEHWIWTFAEAEKFDEITPYIPARGLKPPIASTVYELILAHYLETDIERFKELIDAWDLSLFDIDSIIRSLRTKLDKEEALSTDSKGYLIGDGRKILLESLARLYLEGAMPVDALHCYLRAKNANAVFHLVKKYRLLAAVADRIYSFITVNITDDVLNDGSATLEQLDVLSSDAIKLLAAGTLQHLVPTSNAVRQLESQRPKSSIFLFFFLRTMWDGDIPVDVDDNKSLTPSLSLSRRRRFDRTGAAVTIKASTRSLLLPHIRLAVSLFAEHSRPLLGEILRYSDDSGISLSEESGFYEYALAECEKRNYIPELVSLLSATGQTRRALHLIIDQLENVKQAIAFAKDIDDEELWQDLLDYSMDKPKFVKGLLSEGGASGDRLRPDELVKRIPEGLEIPGLRDGLVAVLRDSDIQSSIADGAAQVSRAEVASRLNDLIVSRTKGVPFDIESNVGEGDLKMNDNESNREANTRVSRKCALCTEHIQSLSTPFQVDRQDHVLAFHCGHIFHLDCMLDHLATPENAARIGDLQHHLGEEDYMEASDLIAKHRTSAKLSRARMIGDILDDAGCVVCQNSV